ncbi:tRNA (cytidine(56)-2'-O)-methyltransferase [Candidatus Bathyarchaeota archaeon]|nr:tRNA (cytidine(56)-2'-O)-methyltransferase [Candidatus Bathyarchaeota archaeon]
MRVYVLRWGHRPRDFRVTSHVALTARAFGASGIILSDSEDRTIERTVRRLVETWGGPFSVSMGVPWISFVKSWRSSGGVTVHLTMYGENIETSDVIKRIKNTRKDLLVLVGSRKVPPDFYSEDVSDFNVAVGNQPHSEIAALAVFLDRLFGGSELRRRFRDSTLEVLPTKRGKRVIPLRIAPDDPGTDEDLEVRKKGEI